MPLIQYELKSLKKRTVQIDVFPLASKLWEEFSQNGVLDRLKEIPQLGAIRVKANQKKTRYDYIMLQLYIHQIMKAELKNYMLYTYNNEVNYEGFSYCNNEGKIKQVTIADIIQLLTLCYSCGVFYNSFVASRAAAILAVENKEFADNVLNSISDERLRHCAERIIEEQDYYHWQLLNATVVLGKCNEENEAVKISKELIYLYLSKSDKIDEKLKYIFSVFSKVRDVSFIAFDLQIANTPISIDLTDEKALLVLLREYISEYNNRQSTNYLIKAIKKLLDDVLYSKLEDEIAYFQISAAIVRRYNKTERQLFDYYSDFIMNSESVFNCNYPLNRDYDSSNILKLTFGAEHKQTAKKWIEAMRHTNHIRVGYYNRYAGEQTVMISIKKSCPNKKSVAFKVLQHAVAIVRKVSSGNSHDSRYILCCKFFLYYLFNSRPIRILPTVDKEICVICTRGHKRRFDEVNRLLISKNGTDDEIHEAEFLLTRFVADTTNDTCISIPASIKVYPNEQSGTILAEFDGMIIHPYRNSKQIVFLEAKNTSEKPNYGRKCLRNKFKKLHIDYTDEAIIRVGYDAFYEYSIKE